MRLPRLLLLLVLPAAAAADPARIVDARAVRDGGTWRVSVTLRHDDSGWDDYADGWRVETEGGAVLATRELRHPHDEEQPFTRSISGVVFRDGAERFHIRARTSTTGWDEQRSDFPLP